MTEAGADPWDPGQYGRFSDQRRQPFVDMLSLVQPVPGGQVVDLGCGSGELTAQLHRHTGAARTLGIDNSEAMLAQSPEFAGGGLSFEHGDIAAFFDGTDTTFDIVFANASLHWVPDHEALLGRMTRALAPGGQIAFQVPANFDHPSHQLAAEIAREERFLAALGKQPPEDHTRSVLAPEAYATMLDGLGFERQHVRLQIYGHHLESTDEVVEWVKGTLLTAYRRRLDPAHYDAFVERLRTRLREHEGDRRPYFYAFKRILCWARLPA